MHITHCHGEYIKDEKYGRDAKVASLLLLDVFGAFDNVSNIRLLHNLRKRRVDERTVKWIVTRNLLVSSKYACT